MSAQAPGCQAEARPTMGLTGQHVCVVGNGASSGKTSHRHWAVTGGLEVCRIVEIDGEHAFGCRETQMNAKGFMQWAMGSRGEYLG